MTQNGEVGAWTTSRARHDYDSSDNHGDSFSDDDDTESYSADNFSSENEEDDMEIPQQQQRDSLFQYTSSLARRRVTSSNDNSVDRDDDHDHDDNEQGHYPHRSPPQRTTRIRRRRRMSNSLLGECFPYEYYHQRWPRLCNHKTNVLLLVSFLIWFAAQIHEVYFTKDPMDLIRQHSLEVRTRLRQGNVTPQEHAALQKQGRDKRRQFAQQQRGFWNNAAHYALDHWILPPLHPPNERTRGDKEKLPTHCKPTEWQTYSFPTCNAIHELDLRQVLNLRSRRGKKRGSHSTASSNDETLVGSGLWRAVWKIHPNQNETMVIKTMRGEHDVDGRNLDRHRRDALVMERLTSQPNIVSMYGYCGNTVLTEYTPLTLDQIIYDPMDMDDTSIKRWHDRATSSTVATRETSLGRLRLALQVARGVAAIHEISGGPILHADIQAQQFLVDAQGTVKLNDFNRCRFMANNTVTGKPCPLRIPTAPGTSRSPEEYNEEELTEQIDMYSTAHVLYGILTGRKPWDDLWATKIKKLIKYGERPPIDKKFLILGTSDAALANLVDLAYEFDPKDRLQASKLVSELERLIAIEEAKQETS